jgi:hypothetical protein
LSHKTSDAVVRARQTRPEISAHAKAFIA